MGRSVRDAKAVTQDGRLLFGPDENGKAVIWDIASGQAVTEFPLSLVPEQRAVFSPDATQVAVYHPWMVDSGITLWDIESRTSRPMQLDPPHDNEISVTSAAFSPDGRYLAVGYQFYWVYVWDLQQGGPPLRIQQSLAMIWFPSMKFSADSSVLAVGSDKGEVALWSIPTGEPLKTFRGSTGAICSIDFSPDGKTLAVGSDDMTVRLWDIVSEQEKLTLRGHEFEVRRVAFSPDGNTLATHSRDGTLKLWKAATNPEARARKTLRDATDRDRPNRLMGLAWEDLHAGHPELAREKVAEILKALEQEQGPVDEYTSTIYYYSALIRLKLDGVEGYRDACGDLLRRSESASDENARQWIAWTCGLAPTAVEDYSIPLQFAHQLVAAYPQDADIVLILGALLYRNGEYPEAVARFEESLRLNERRRSDETTSLYSKLFLAMTEWRLDHKEVARRMLRELHPEIEKVLTSSVPWNRRATTEFLHREAADLLGISAPPPATDPATQL
jgi:tetratricopeptide (TPR) repeat protein